PIRIPSYQIVVPTTHGLQDSACSKEEQRSTGYRSKCFDNLGTSFKYQFVGDAHRELAMSASLGIDWGGTGAKAIGAEPFTTLTPTWFAGKGFGFLPEQLKLLRPLGITTELGYSFPTQSSAREMEDGTFVETRNPQFLVWGGSLQYSFPYLKE